MVTNGILFQISVKLETQCQSNVLSKLGVLLLSLLALALINTKVKNDV